MPRLSYPISDELANAIRDIFGESEDPLYKLGVLRMWEGLLEDPVDVDSGVIERLAGAVAKIEQHIVGCAKHCRDLKSDVERNRIRFIVDGLLIALREIHDSLPDAFHKRQIKAN